MHYVVWRASAVIEVQFVYLNERRECGCCCSELLCVSPPHILCLVFNKELSATRLSCIQRSSTVKPVDVDVVKHWNSCEASWRDLSSMESSNLIKHVLILFYQTRI